MALFKKKIFCRLCKSKDLVSSYTLEDTPIEDDYTKKKNTKILIPTEIKSCKMCGFKQLSVTVNEKKVYGDFLYATGTSYKLKEHFRNHYKKINKFTKNLKREDLIVDFGSSDGTNLEIFKKKGYKNLVGIEPSKRLSKITKKKKIDVITDFFSNKVAKKIKKKYGTAKIVCIYNLLANIDDLDSFFKNLKIFTNKNTTIFFENFSLLGVIKENLFDSIYHEHLSYFHIKPLQGFLKKYGWNIKYAGHNKVKGGSLELILGKDVFGIDKKSITNSLKVEKKYKLMEHNIFNKIIKKNKIIKIQLNKILKKFEDKRIVGYGASCGSTVFLYNYGLTKKFKFLLDDEKRRNNLYSPRANIKVFNPTIKIMSKIDIILIISWRYGKIIYKKYQERFVKKIKNKILWLQVLPKIKIIK